MEQRDRIRLDSKKFGIQDPPNTPTGIIEGEGAMFRGMTDANKKRSGWVRLFAIIVSLVALLIPGLFYLVLGFGHMIGAKEPTSVGAIIFGLVFTVAGVAGLFINFKKQTDHIKKRGIL